MQSAQLANFDRSWNLQEPSALPTAPPCPLSPEVGGGGVPQMSTESGVSQNPGHPALHLPQPRGQPGGAGLWTVSCPSPRLWVRAWTRMDRDMPLGLLSWGAAGAGGCVSQCPPRLSGQDASPQQGPRTPILGSLLPGAGVRVQAVGPSLHPWATPRASLGLRPAFPWGPLLAPGTKRPLSKDGRLSLPLLPGKASRQEPLAVGGSSGLEPLGSEATWSLTHRISGHQAAKGPVLPGIWVPFRPDGTAPRPWWKQR